MKRFYRFLFVIGGFSLIVTSQFNQLACARVNNFINKDIIQHEANTSFLNYNLPINYLNFVSFYQDQMAKPVTNSEQIAFQNLYDPTRITPIYNNFTDLVTSLTSTKMGTQTAVMNWLNLYHMIGLSGTKLASVEAAQLRFYNIIAKVYSKAIVNQLVQSIGYANFGDTGALGVTIYSPSTAAQKMRFATNFTDLSLLNDNYNLGQFAGTDINYVVDHEYGHALSNYVRTDINGRSEFNQTWLNSEKSKNNYLQPQAIVNQDNTQALLDFLNKQGNQFAQDNNLADYYYPNYQKNSLIFPLMLLPSNYSRVWFFNTDESLKDEYFAEAFAFWLTTPPEERGWNWGFFNDFFIDFFPKNYVLN